MKNLFMMIAIALLGLCAFGAIDTVTVPTGESVEILFPAKVLRIEVVSSVASGKATVKDAKTLLGSTSSTETLSSTNVTYTSISTNDLGVCTTNVTAFDQAPFLPPAPFLLSYATNATITSWTVTNVTPVVLGTVTNNVGSEITCSSGFGSTTPSDAYLAPGDVLSVSGTASGKVTLILEK